ATEDRDMLPLGMIVVDCAFCAKKFPVPAALEIVTSPSL
ncbi:MAG: Hsp33 family molecular chaperone HslO, partial [Lysobacteraceae bacterium]